MTNVKKPRVRNGSAHIRSIYSALAPAEQKVADFVLNSAQEVIYLTVSQLAEECGVAESTVIRFCQNAGFTGYQELKLTLARDVVRDAVETPEDMAGDITSHDSLEEIARKVSHANSKALEDTLSLLDMHELERAISAMLGARKISFYGLGASGVTAHDAKYRFFRLGLACDAFTEPHIMAMAAATASEQDVVLGFSISGSTKDVVSSIGRAKGNGATIICITAHMRSPMTKIADIVLSTAQVETPLGASALRSKIAQLHVMDILYTGLALRLGQEGRDNMEKTADAVLDKVY